MLGYVHLGLALHVIGMYNGDDLIRAERRSMPCLMVLSDWRLFLCSTLDLLLHEAVWVALGYRELNSFLGALVQIRLWRLGLERLQTIDL